MTTTDLGTLGGPSSRAFAVSGTIVVGDSGITPWAAPVSDSYQAFAYHPGITVAMPNGAVREAGVSRPARTHTGCRGRGVLGSLLDHGSAIESPTAFIMGSPEYYACAGGTPNGFVSAMFQDVLHRAPDAGGRAYFVQLLQQGVSHSAVAGAITWSAEAIGSRVNGRRV